MYYGTVWDKVLKLPYKRYIQGGDFSPPTSILELYTITTLSIGGVTKNITLNDLGH